MYVIMCTCLSFNALLLPMYSYLMCIPITKLPFLKSILHLRKSVLLLKSPNQTFFLSSTWREERKIRKFRMSEDGAKVKGAHYMWMGNTLEGRCSKTWEWEPCVILILLLLEDSKVCVQFPMWIQYRMMDDFSMAGCYNITDIKIWSSLFVRRFGLSSDFLLEFGDFFAPKYEF